MGKEESAFMQEEKAADTCGGEQGEHGTRPDMLTANKDTGAEK